jgi:AraC-like DNA-binding protein
MAKTSVTDRQWVHIRHAAALADTEIVAARFTRHVFPIHAHAEYVISVVMEGAEAFAHGRVQVFAPRGSLVLLNPFEEHTGRAVGASWRHIALFPKFDCFQQWLDTNAFQLASPIVTDPLGARLILRLAQSVSANSDVLEVQCNFASLLEHLAEHHTRDAGESKQPYCAAEIKCARELLDQNLSADVDLAKLAFATGLPALTLLRSFRKSLGCTPHAYRTAQRLKMAKLALRKGRPPALVAADAGFFDQSHMTRVFRKHIGITPGDYQKTGRRSAPARAAGLSDLC